MRVERITAEKKKNAAAAKQEVEPVVLLGPTLEESNMADVALNFPLDEPTAEELRLEAGLTDPKASAASKAGMKKRLAVVRAQRRKTAQSIVSASCKH